MAGYLASSLNGYLDGYQHDCLAGDQAGYLGGEMAGYVAGYVAVTWLATATRLRGCHVAVTSLRGKKMELLAYLKENGAAPGLAYLWGLCL